MNALITILGAVLVAIISAASGALVAWMRSRVDHTSMDHARIEKLEHRLDKLEERLDSRNAYIDDLRAHINAHRPPPPPPFPWLAPHPED